MVLQCPLCGSGDIDWNEASGHSACMECGCVVEENAIVSSIEFQETGERSSVIGQYVSATCSKPYNSMARGRSRYGNSRESRDTTLAQARRIIAQVSSTLRLQSSFVDRAYRLYQIALDKNFVFGRRQMHVVATCLYTICRQEKSPHLLIDFSDALQVNIFILGGAFLRFIRMLNINLPPVDPSLYLHRFAARLELDDKLSSVVTTSLRIVTRLKKDWISTGRRPDGICAAALLISIRAHGLNRSQQDIAKLFRIATETLRLRLADFKATPSAMLSLDQFHQHDHHIEYDPPSYIRNAINEYPEDIVILNSIDAASYLVQSQHGDENSDAVTIDGAQYTHRQSFQTVIGNISVTVPLPQVKKPSTSAVIRTRMEARENLYENLEDELMNADLEHNCTVEPSASSSSSSSSSSMKLGDYIGDDDVDLGGEKQLPKAIKASIITNPGSSSSNNNGMGDDDECRELDIIQYILPADEQKKKSDIWEKQYRPFMEDRQRRQLEKDQVNKSDPERATKRAKTKSSDGSTVKQPRAAVPNVEKIKKPSSKINHEAFLESLDANL